MPLTNHPNYTMKRQDMHVISKNIAILTEHGYNFERIKERMNKVSKKRNETVEIKIERTDFPAKGFGTHQNRLISVKGVIQGQIVSVKTERRREHVTEAKLLQVIQSSPFETETPCPHADFCGGCLYQRLPYKEELRLKEEQMKRLFETDFPQATYRGVLPSFRPHAYRNKMEFTFGDMEKGGPMTLGLHVKRQFHSIVSVPDCKICDKDFGTVLSSVEHFFSVRNIPHYNRKNHTGFLRHLVMRKALTTGEILLTLSTTSERELPAEDLVRYLTELPLHGSVVGIFHTVNDSVGDVVKPEALRLIYGRTYITENILGLSFDISPFSFFQTNSLGAETLYREAIKMAGDLSDKIVFDLYSGTGTISCIVAKKAKKVYGIEIVEEAVVKARENSRRNNLENVEFLSGDVLKMADELSVRPDLIIVDPPREGIVPKALEKILRFEPQNFLYISCNPLTLVRDLKTFAENGYRAKTILSVDMFPRTANLETIVYLSKYD